MSAALLEQQAEKKIIDALVALAIPGCAIRGFWQAGSAGTVSSSDANGGALLFVAMSPRGFSTMQTSTANLVCELIYSVSDSVCTDNGQLATAWAPIINLLQTWHNDLATARAALSIAAVLQVDGFTIGPGSAAWDDQKRQRVARSRITLDATLL